MRTPRRPRARVPPRRERGHGGCHRGVDLRDGIDGGEDAAAHRGASPGGQAPDGVEQHVPVGGRRLDELREPRERDDADERAGVLPLDERRCRLLCRRQPAGRDVGGAHAARHVHDHQDRGLAGGHADDRGGSRECHHDRGDGRREQRERQVATHPRGAGSRRRHQRQAREPDRGPAAAPLDHEVQRDERRHQQQQQHQERCPQQGHGRRPSHASAATPPRVRSARPSAATSDVTSVVSVSTTRRVSSES